MKFMILMADGAGAWDRLDPTEQADVFRKHEEFGRALRSEGKFIASRRLHLRKPPRPCAATPRGAPP